VMVDRRLIAGSRSATKRRAQHHTESDAYPGAHGNVVEHDPDAGTDGDSDSDPLGSEAARLVHQLRAIMVPRLILLARTEVVKHPEPVAIQIFGRELPEFPTFGFQLVRDVDTTPLPFFVELVDLQWRIQI
jgi:hypothetical protein